MDAEPGGGRGRRREREFRRYAEAVLNVGERSKDDIAISSIDVPLTAFAQLIALRLHAKRVLISLFDNTHQYVLAEATASLSLQQDSDHDDGDAMLIGSQKMPRSNDWFDEALHVARKHNRHGQSNDEHAILIIPDLLRDGRYSQHPYVTGSPLVRSYIGLPLLSPGGYAIGALSVLDDKARPDGIAAPCIKVMRDVSISIMAHLERARTKTVHDRATRMVQGLCRFIEGKDSLVDDPRHGAQDAEQVSLRLKEQSSRLGASARTHAMDSGSNNERVDDARVVPRSRSGQGRGSPVGRRQVFMDATTTIQAQRDVGPRGPPDATVSAMKHLKASSSAERLQQDVVSVNVAQAFQRAATLIQQAMDMAGVLMLDAVVGDFGGLRNSDDSDLSPANTGSERSSPSRTESAQKASSKGQATKKSKPCRNLASAHAENVDLSLQTAPISERFLRSLVRRYPHGKIFNWAEDGSLLSSSDHSDQSAGSGSEAKPPSDEVTISVKSNHTRRKKRKGDLDAIELGKTIPGVRSFAMLPMWNSQKGRFLSVAVVWSYNRFFTFQDDLNFLGAFCDVLMTEVERLEVQADAKSKSTFIASISHELRSPLHGILGGAEFLQEDDDDPSLRQQMVQMIDSCGRSLLDMVNNLLEHAHAASGDDTGQAKSVVQRRGPKQPTTADTVQDLAILTEDVLHSMLHATPRPATAPTSPNVTSSASPFYPEDAIKVILDLDGHSLPPTGWGFHVNAGAYRRILQNLASNAMKYTDRSGYCRCRLSVTEPGTEGKPTTIELECSDSGKGMSEQYLKHGLWQAFNQEDSHAQGTGLGLNLVHNLVKDMGGNINVRSTKDVGTSIKVILHLFPGQAESTDILDSSDAVELKKLKYNLVGFENEPHQKAKNAYGNHLLRLSIGRTCQYLGLLPADGPSGDGAEAQFAIVTERTALIATRQPSHLRQQWQDLPCIILCDSVAASRSIASAVSNNLRQAITVSQPLGPRQLLQSLTLCLNKKPQSAPRQSFAANRDTNPSYSAAPTPVSESSGFKWDSNPDPTVETEKEPAATDEAHLTTAELAIEQQFRRTVSPVFRRPSVRPAASSVLVVDDNPVNLTLLERYMKKLQRSYVGAVNGQEALEAYKNNHATGRQDTSASPSSPISPTNPSSLPISVIFMDITMPVMDGLESTRRIRAYERTVGLGPVMIVALTALASPDARQEAYSSGIDLFLTKPVRYKDIEQMCKEWEVEIG